MRRTSRRKSNNPYTTGVLDKTISNVYGESLATTIASGSSNFDAGKIFVALQNNRTNVDGNIYAPFSVDRDSPVRGLIQFDLKHASSGIGSKDTVVQAVLFLKVNDVSPVWPGYGIDVCKIDGVSLSADATWATRKGNVSWGDLPTGLTPQIGVGYSLNQQDDTPFDVNGYYPLYLTKQGAVKKSPTPKESRTPAERSMGWVGYHEHTINGAVYYMPNGLGDSGNQYHGNYTEKTTLGFRYGFNEFATKGEALVRASKLGCNGFHTTERNGNLIYKPCENVDLFARTIRKDTAPTRSQTTIKSESSKISSSKSIGSPLPSSTNNQVVVTNESLVVNGQSVNNANTSDEELNSVDQRNVYFTSGGGRIEKDTFGNEIKISKLGRKNIRKNELLIIDVSNLVETAISNNERYLPILLKGSHDLSTSRTESKANARVGPQDQYVSFYSFSSSIDSTVYKGTFNTTSKEVTGTVNVDLYTSDSAGSTPDGTGAYIMRPTEGARTKEFNNFFSSVSAGDTVTFQSGTVNINATTKVDIANTTLTVEGYNKDYIQFQNNPIAGFTPGTYTDISIKMNKTTTVNELELISSSSGNPMPKFKAFEPFAVAYHGDSSGSNSSKTFTPTSIKRRDGNVVVTVKETVVSEQHVDHSGGLRFTNLADGPRLKIYYRTKRN